MIIQCQQCQTRFRLDDSRVTDKGVKVRCTKCKHVFMVQKEQPEVGSFEPEEGLTGVVSPFEQVATPAEAPEDKFAPESATADSFSTGAFEAPSSGSEPADFGVLDSSFFDDSATPFGSDGLESEGTENAPPADKGGEIDFSSFDFGGSGSESDSALPNLSGGGFTETATDSSLASPQEESSLEFNFSADMFGEQPAQSGTVQADSSSEFNFSDDTLGAASEAEAEPEPEASGNAISFDFEDDGFAESADSGGQVDASGEAPFAPGDIDFGAEHAPVADQHAISADLTEIGVSPPPAEAIEKQQSAEPSPSVQFGAVAADQQELPPLSIASRRKQSPIFGALIAVIAVLVVSVLGYLGYSSLSTPKETAAPETGKIGVRAVKAAFIKNDKSGELLVISGEALNEYPKARAALQVKVTVFDAAGQSIATKSAYGGNPLTKEQLESLPLDKIEAAMANQFGDSLANMEVAPGKVIPFVIALANLPKGAKDFAVQTAGSTVATGKQQ